MNHSIANHLRGEATLHFDPFPGVLRTLDNFFAALHKEDDWRDRDIVVFIDTNPAFTEYTQLALCECVRQVAAMSLQARVGSSSSGSSGGGSSW